MLGLRAYIDSFREHREPSDRYPVIQPLWTGFSVRSWSCLEVCMERCACARHMGPRFSQMTSSTRSCRLVLTDNLRRRLSLY